MMKGTARAWLGAASLAAASLCDPRGAAAASGVGVLDAPAASADLLRVDCFDDGSGAPASLVGELTDVGPVAAPLLSVQLRKGVAASSASDPVDGDGLPSPPVLLNGGSGSYDVYVDKTGPGEESYSLVLRCMTGNDGGGVATGTMVTGWATVVPVSAPLARLLGAAAMLVVGLHRLPRRRGARRRSGSA